DQVAIRRLNSVAVVPSPARRNTLRRLGVAKSRPAAESPVIQQHQPEADNDRHSPEDESESAHRSKIRTAGCGKITVESRLDEKRPEGHQRQGRLPWPTPV